MSNPDIPSRHADDARADSAAPTDAVTDEVREDAAEHEEHVDLDSDTGDAIDGEPKADDPGFPSGVGGSREITSHGMRHAPRAMAASSSIT